MKNAWILFSFAAILAACLILLGINLILAKFVPDSTLSFLPILLLTILITLVILTVTLIKGWTQVPHNYEYIVEYLGEFIGWPLEHGLHILFPWFNLVTVRPVQFLGVRTMQLYLDEKKANNRGGGSVEFKNTSAPITAFVYYRVDDSEKATYNVDDLEHAVEEMTDHVLRAFFGPYTIDEAIALKSKIGIKEVACLVDFIANPDAEVNKDDFKNSHYYKTLLNWGVIPTNLAVSDIMLPPEILAGRQKVFDADQDRQAAEKKREEAIIVADQKLQVSKINKNSTIVDAQAKKEADELRGAGEGNRLLKIAEISNLSPEDAAKYFVVINKWNKIETLKANPNISLIEGDNGSASVGAGIGLGIKSVNEEKEETKKTEGQS